MSDGLAQLATGAESGLDWLTWLAVGAFALFCVLCVLAALLAMAGRRLPRSVRVLQPRSLRARLLLGFPLAAVLPAVSLGLFLSERAADQRREAASLLLTAEAEALATRAESLLDRAVAGLTEVAAAVRPEPGSSDLESEGPTLRTYQAFTGSDLVVAADTVGRVVASAHGPGRAVDMARFEAAMATADYFSQPLQSGKPFVSGLGRGEGDAARSSAAVGVPIIDSDGAAAGVVIGLYDLREVMRVRRPPQQHSGIRTALLDQTGAPALGEAGPFSARPDGLDAAARYLTASTSFGNGSRAVAYAPRDEIIGPPLEHYAIVFAWLLGGLLIATCLAAATYRSLSDPLAVAGERIKGFGTNRNRGVPAAPDDAPAEVGAVFAQFAALEERVRATHRILRNSVEQGEKLRGELIRVIASREGEIEQRTEELKEVNQTLQRLSREDRLTGLANRRSFAEFLARAWQGALREKKPLSVLIIDIDQFKAYNETYGHAKGDGCLKLVAATIRRAVGRASDLVSRYGGEEFIVVLGDTPLEGGLRIAENIRSSVEQLDIPHDGARQRGCVTVSIGVTSTLPTADTHPETVLVAADRAMYSAKNEGRNRVAFSTAARTGIYQALCLPNGAATPAS